MAVVLETIGTAGKALQAMAVAEGVIRLTGLDKEREPREESDMSEEQPQETRTIVDEIEVEGRELVARVQELIREGNVRKVRVKDSKGRYLIEIPLTAGVVLGGVIALSSPPMLALSVLAGFVAKIEIEVVREVPESRLEESADAEKKEE
jgi:hypothetical protein